MPSSRKHGSPAAQAGLSNVTSEQKFKQLMGYDVDKQITQIELETQHLERKKKLREKERKLNEQGKPVVSNLRNDSPESKSPHTRRQRTVTFNLDLEVLE